MKWLIRILAGVALVAIVACVVLWLMGLRHDAGFSRASVEINAPRENMAMARRGG